MPQRRKGTAVRVLPVLLAAGFLFAVASMAADVGRLDLPVIARQVKTRGLADYIPVAYKTAGIDDDDWAAVDHAKAHFCLYLARDASHFVLKWEIPALIPLYSGPGPERYVAGEARGIYGGPGGGRREFRNNRRNILLRSYEVGRMPRIWTRGPLNAMADAAQEGPVGGLDEWGALIHCGIYLGGAEADLGDPVAIYNTPTSDSGDALSGAAVMEVPPSAQGVIRTMLRVRAVSGEASPLYWRLCVNMFNVTIQHSMVKLKETWAAIDTTADPIFKVLDFFLFWAGQTETTATEFVFDAMLEASNPLPTGSWDIISYAINHLVNEALGKMADLVLVRVGYMREQEAFRVAPWTYIQLEGPAKGTDTWDAVEARGGYVGSGEYTWVVGAGAITDWAARLSTDPSVITMPGIQMTEGGTCEIEPTSLTWEFHRDNDNWEEVDRSLVENYVGDVNAPVFEVHCRPKVNYEILGQEARRRGGEDSIENASLTRRQLFHSVSICSGAERSYWRREARIDWEAGHEQAVSLRAKSLEVDVTFQRGVMPQGGWTLSRQTVQALWSVPLVPIGGFHGETLVCQYSDRWWYQAGVYRRQRLADQRRYWVNRRADLIASWRRDTQEQIGRWRDSWGPYYPLQQGAIVYNPDARHFSCSQAVQKMKMNYLPSYRELQLAEDLNWERLVVDRPTTERPDLASVAPALKMEGNRLVLSYKNPRTGQERMMVIPVRAAPKK